MPHVERPTTEPPVLPPDHPIRRAFYRYGFAAARHWLAFILSSVAVAVLLCYPVFFLYENPTTGFSKLPLHVWTSARNYDGHPNTLPDVVVRQIWVHGNHMGALKKDVLLEALRIQEALLAPQTPDSSWNADIVASDAIGDAAGDSWGYHSPLMFWNSSRDAIIEDEDILGTIAAQSTRRSYLNLTLRPTSVFAGKQFEKNRVVAADALILTLFDRRKSDTDRLWDPNFDHIAKHAHSQGNYLYPRDGHVQQYHLYEFQQKPLSVQDRIFLLASYFLMTVYVIVSLGKLRAVKSWAGLFVTVMVEIVVSIMASLSVCGMLGIDLARIPDAAYPFVVLVMGLENMFRLIDAVLAQKPETSTSQRLATALSQVGHLSLATAAQMLFVLWILARVAPDVSAFCCFAAIALVFDFLFHLTFFYAVLSVDVRRFELQDLLDRVKSAPPGRRRSLVKHEKTWWLWALTNGRLPFGTRIVGITISTSFMLMVNMHFSGSTNSLWSFIRSLQSMFFQSVAGRGGPSFIAPPINQARTPAAWLRIQDYRYAQEVLHYVKPSSTAIIARVYDPLVIVSKNANRSGRPVVAEPFFAMIWSLFQKHIYPFLLVLILCVAIVALLMQYLLWNAITEEELESRDTTPALLAVDSLPNSHQLDIIHLVGSDKGHLVSVSLDRLITFATLEAGMPHSLNSIYAHRTDPLLWPVTALALDDSGTWAAVYGPKGKVMIWDMAERRMIKTLDVDLNEQQPVLFSLLTSDSAEGRLSLIIATPDGVVQVFDPLEPELRTSFRLSQQRISLALVARSRLDRTIVALLKNGKVRIAVSQAGGWAVSAAESKDPRLAPTSEEGVIKSLSVTPLPDIIAAVRLRVIDLIDTSTETLIYSFPAILVRGHSLRILSSQIRKCKTCQSTAVHSLSLAYNDFESHTLVMRTYTLSDDRNDLMCLAPRIAGKHRSCRGLSHAEEYAALVENPGHWEMTNSQAIIGLRHTPSGADTPQSTMSIASGVEVPLLNLSAYEVVNARGPMVEEASQCSTQLQLDKPSVEWRTPNEEWKMYSLLAGEEAQFQPLHSTVNVDEQTQSLGEDDLLVSTPGPIVRLGQKSVAVGFGNRVKIIMQGTERFETGSADFQDIAQAHTTRKRKVFAKRAA